MKLTGSEYRKLSHIARYPRSRHSRALFRVLTGEARTLAKKLLEGSSGISLAELINSHT